MGVGKSYICEKIASQNNINSIDLDKEIELNNNMNIAEIFETKGEEYFRIQERIVLIDIITNKKNYIISCGGGTPCFKNNIDIMNKYAATIYLKDTPLNIYNRLIKDKYERPMIKNIKQSELLNFIKKHLSKREFFYKKSKHIIDLNEVRENKAIEYILNLK